MREELADGEDDVGEHLDLGLRPEEAECHSSVYKVVTKRSTSALPTTAVVLCSRVRSKLLDHVLAGAATDLWSPPTRSAAAHRPPTQRRDGPPGPVHAPGRRPVVHGPRLRHLHCYGAAHRVLCRVPPRRHALRLLPRFASTSSEFPGADPFYIRYESLRRVVPVLLGPLLINARALVADIALASVAIPVARELGFPCYVFFTASATMLAFKAYFHIYLDSNGGGTSIGDVEIPGVYRVPISSVPQALHDPDNIFTRQFVANGRALTEADGLLVNAFDAMEPEAVASLQSGAVVAGLPHVFAVGPLVPVDLRDTGEAAKEQGSGSSYMAWLHKQPVRSVVYVSFGSRKALAMSQIRELAGGLEASGYRFLWIDEVLRRPAVGLFVSHCGWNSVTEAARSGVPVLAWPRFADQRVNARVVARCGAGVWTEHWSREGEEMVVTAEEIAEKVKAAMASMTLTQTAARVRDAAVRATADGGTSHRSLAEFMRQCRDGTVGNAM
ncbi:hypothetical protein QOZ80_6AG0517750 [Eleusine coracana subsp. coracana]|nr:hypothetical protein QOZ80_6AG0517750 [Eleusine coracana subsp. coracana]